MTGIVILSSMVSHKKNTKPSSANQILNRRARYDYELLDEIVVGLELTGLEVRAARDGHVQLRGSFVSNGSSHERA